MANIAFTDNGDGTGGIFAITGSSGGTNTLWVSMFQGSNNAPFVNAGSRVGDGSIAFATDAGPGIAFVITDNSGTLSVSDPKRFRVTSGASSLHMRCAIAIREWILSMNIPGVPTEPELHTITKVGARLETILAERDPIGTSCVYYIPVIETHTPADNVFNSVRYPVQVILLIESGQNLHAGLEDILHYRELMHLGIEQLNDVPEVHDTIIQPGAIVDPGRWVQNYDASILTVICESEQRRGIA